MKWYISFWVNQHAASINLWLKCLCFTYSKVNILCVSPKKIIWEIRAIIHVEKRHNNNVGGRRRHIVCVVGDNVQHKPTAQSHGRHSDEMRKGSVIYYNWMWFLVVTQTVRLVKSLVEDCSPVYVLGVTPVLLLVQKEMDCLALLSQYCSALIREDLQWMCSGV